MADQDRNSDGTAPTPVRESLEVGSVEDREAFEDSLEREGLSESEGADRLDALLQAAAETEGGDPPEGVDPEMWDSAREALEETGSIEAAHASLEELLAGEEVAEHEAAEEGESGPVPFSQLSEELGVTADDVTVRVQVQGEEQEVSLSEAREGFMKGRDYTKKTQELAEQRREVQEAREAYAQQLEMLAVGLGQNLTPEQQDALRQRYNAVVSEIQAHTNEQLTGTVQEEAQTLRDKMGWDDPETWDEARTNLRSYVTDVGFSEEEASMVHDHRLLVLAEKARRYDQLAEQGEALVSERPKQSGKTLTPGDQNPGRGPRSKRRKKVSDARKKVRRTGREKDAAAAILESGII